MPLLSDHEPDFMAGAGDMARRMRAYDWAATPLGAPAGWPQSLKTVVRILLTSRFAMWMGWGPDLVFFYNDAYAPTLGVKHPRALGLPAREVWAEIWPDISPLVDSVMRTGEASWNEGLLLFLERSGVREETYHTFSYSALFADDGTTVGMLCVVTEETQRVIAERRLATLSRLALELASTNGEAQVLRAVEREVGANLRDLPFTLTYLFDAGPADARLVCATGIAPGHVAAPWQLAPAAAGNSWPLLSPQPDDALEPWRIDDLATRFDALPTGAWDTPPQEALVLPLRSRGDEAQAGVFIAALNPNRAFDADYASFVGLVANQIASSLANARAYAQASQRAEVLAQLDRAKTAFFSNVSHEFRTPLTLLLAPVEELLSENTLAAGDLERVTLVHRNALRLLKLVNALLDFSRIEAGRIQARFVGTDLAAVTAELASNFRSAVEKAGLAFHVDCPPLPAPVWVDLDMWEKIVLNLLSNAFKFTFAGRIDVSLREEGAGAVLRVADTGTGIPAHELPRTFERFHRVEGARGRSFEGSGIGLALVHELVTLHGGTIEVASEPGRGTVFTLALRFGSAHLPAEQLADAASGAAGAREASLAAESHVHEALGWLEAEPPGPLAAPAIAPAPLPDPARATVQRARVLLADDNADMRAYVERLLATHHHVTVVPDGQAALEAARARRPDLVLTDIMMPRLDGFGLISALRADDALRDVPIIALSARAGEEARIEGLARGADDYLVKPFSARELVARVDSALAGARVRRDVAQALRQSEERFRSMADSAPVMVWTTDASGSCTFLSKSWYAFTGQTPQTGLGFGWLDATHPQDREEAGRIFLEANAQRRSFALEYRLRRHDGVYRWAIDAAAPWLADDGTFLGYIGSVIDITERKEIERVLEQRVGEAVADREVAQAQLRQAQKMEALGNLTGGVAHDFNNLLQVIGGNLQLLAKDLDADPRAQQRVRNALTGVTRGARLAGDLLAFGRRQPLDPKVLNLGRLLRGMEDMLQRALGEAIEIEVVVSGGLWNALADAGQLENAILNLAINARDAMQGRGRLTIEAGNASLDDDYAQRHADVTRGQYVMVAVTDTGCGIPAELQERVFEPFFTTKPEGQGTGLGLSMVYGFARQSGGHVKLYSEPQQGTTVRLYLPRTRDAEAMAPPPDSGPVAGGDETVLVVEDDETVRETVVELLGDLGYRVLKARDADAALAILESGVPVDLLFTDVVMPGSIRSPELARRARARMPGLPVLFTSGYTDNAIVHGGRLDPGIELLSKPYTREALARRVRQLLRPRAVAAPPRTEPANGLRVLVVDDDAMISASTSDLLELSGHSASIASSVQAALDTLARKPFDVLMTDLALPGASGNELVLQARRDHPDLAVVVVSGHEASAVSPALERYVFLRKPYTDTELERALRSSLDARPSAFSSA